MHRIVNSSRKVGRGAEGFLNEIMLRLIAPATQDCWRPELNIDIHEEEVVTIETWKAQQVSYSFDGCCTSIWFVDKVLK